MQLVKLVDNIGDIMENNVLKVDINSLKDVSIEIDRHNKAILDILNDIARDFSNLDECFDSKTAKDYKVVMEKCLNKTREIVTNRNEFLIGKLNEITEMYWELYDEVRKTVTGNGKVK